MPLQMALEFGRSQILNSFRVRIFLCCVPAIFTNGCDPIDPCAGTCDPSEICINGECVECESDGDCDPNEQCDDGTCETKFVTCDSEEDCLGNQTCVLGTCDGGECESDADCGAIIGGLCSNGRCLLCITNAQCEMDKKCFGGSCVPRDACESDADCDADKYCSTGACFPDCDPNDCNDNNACTSDSCVDQACSNTRITCDTAATCPAGCNAECLGGICFAPF